MDKGKDTMAYKERYFVRILRATPRVLTRKQQAQRVTLLKPFEGCISTVFLLPALAVDKVQKQRNRERLDKKRVGTNGRCCMRVRLSLLLPTR